MISFIICIPSNALKKNFFFFRIQLFYMEGALLEIKRITPPRGSRLLFIYKYLFIWLPQVFVAASRIFHCDTWALYLWHAGVQSIQSCSTRCNPMDCSLPGSSVHGIFLTRILEWVAMPFSRGSSRPRDRNHISSIGRWFLNHWTTREVPRLLFKRMFPTQQGSKVSGIILMPLLTIEKTLRNKWFKFVAVSQRLVRIWWKLEAPQYIYPQNMLHTISGGAKSPDAHLWTLPMESKNFTKEK